MRQNIGWGVAAGSIVALLSWSREPGRDGVASLFPDVVALIAFVVLAAFILERVLRPAATWKEAVRSVCTFGISGGLVLAIATLLRGLARWGEPSASLVVSTLVGSLVIVLLLSCSIGFLMFHTRMRRAPVGIQPDHS